MSNVDSRVVRPCPRIGGVIRVPGDKSISHRAAMLTGLTSGGSTIERFLLSEDCLNTLRAVEELGASVNRTAAVVRIRGTGGVFTRPTGVLDLGNSGTGMRLLAGLLAGQRFASEMTGDASLRSRPMRRIKEPLELMGAKVELLGENGCAPMRISGGVLRGIEYELPVASAQVKSCILLAGLFADGKTTVIEPRPTRDHTERMLKAAGIPLECDGLRISLKGFGRAGPRFEGRKWTVPGDFSSAAFWMTAAACREGSEVEIEGVGLNPRRTAFIGVLCRMGAEIEVIAECEKEWEPAGTVRVKGGRLNGTEVGGDEISNLIDELPLVGVAGALAEGKTVIKDAGELRVKESDRIATMCAGLSALGVDVEEKPAGMIVRGASRIRGGTEVDSHGDHRIAMALAVLALFADTPVRIVNTACVSTSYPGFWDDLERMVDGRMVNG